MRPVWVWLVGYETSVWVWLVGYETSVGVVGRL